MDERMRIAVVGIGQSMRGDDAAGLEAVRLWQVRFPVTASRPDLRVETCGLPGLGLLDLMDGLDAALLVDAIRSTAVPPGTILRLGPDELSAFAAGSGSAHGWGIAESLQLGRALDADLAACHLTLVGIVGERFDPGQGLSPRVRDALEEVVQAIEREVQSML